MFKAMHQAVCKHGLGTAWVCSTVLMCLQDHRK